MFNLSKNKLLQRSLPRGTDKAVCRVDSLPAEHNPDKSSYRHPHNTTYTAHN